MRLANCTNCFTPVEKGEGVKCNACNHFIHRDCAIKASGTFFCDLCYTVQLETPKTLEFELPERIRRTYIEIYRTCPQKFFKEVLQGHTQPPTCYTQIGIDLHDLFEKAVLDPSFRISEFLDAWSQIWLNYPDELFESQEQMQNMSQRAIDSIETFYEVLPTLDKVFTTEETITYSVGDDVPNVEFTMDLITENAQGNLDMHDWKTGNVMVGKKISSDLQAPLYIYGVQQHFNRQVDSFTFYYLKENKTRRFDRVDDDTFVCRVGKREYFIHLTDTIKEIKRIFNQIKKGNFNIPQDTRSMYFACKMCHLRAQNLCMGADEEAWAMLNN